jgi:hypothetical protein
VGASVIAAFVAAAAACSLSSVGREGSVDSGTGDVTLMDTNPPPEETGPDEGADAMPDVVVDAGADCSATSFTCNGACVDTCEGCAAGPALCPTTRACGNCNGCTGFDIECFTCGDGGAMQAFCGQTGGQRCGQVPHCACADGDAGSCPGASQTCDNTGQCLSCGEPGSMGLACNGNGSICAANATPPACTPDGG